MISALRPRAVSSDATRAAMSRLNAYSQKRPSGLRLPAVNWPWPLSIKIFILLWCYTQLSDSNSEDSDIL